MGTDWMNLTVEPSDDIPDKYLASSSPPTTSEIVRTRLSDYGDFAGVYLPTVKMRQQNNIDSFVQNIATEMPCNRILAIRISDSTHAGDGILFNVNKDGTVERIEEWSGYCGAKGADVRGYFREEYNIEGSYEYIWD